MARDFGHAWIEYRKNFFCTFYSLSIGTLESSFHCGPLIQLIMLQYSKRTVASTSSDNLLVHISLPATLEKLDEFRKDTEPLPPPPRVRSSKNDSTKTLAC